MNREIPNPDWKVSGETMLTDAQRRMFNAISYDADTGLFHWRINGRGKTKRAGAAAGSTNSKGYVRIKVYGVTYYAHRLAWLFVHGRFPMIEIDHINRNRADNRLINLREATLQQNRWNTVGIPRRRKHSKFKGVTVEHNSKKWKAQISNNGKLRVLGHFNTEREAAAAYAHAAIETRGEFAKW